MSASETSIMLISVAAPKSLLAVVIASIAFHLIVLDDRSAQAADDPWQLLQVPEVWRKPPEGRGGYSWYRCLLRVPQSWRDRELSLFVEPVDDAREVFFNGVKVGAAGSFPPQFRSGLGDPDRHAD